VAGEGAGDPLVDALDVFPDAVRDHPSVIPTAIAEQVHVLHDLGWPKAEIRRQLVGVETADKLGAAALTRLDALAGQEPPSPPLGLPSWSGPCNQRTRLR
jgi:hypothetical protein